MCSDSVGARSGVQFVEYWCVLVFSVVVQHSDQELWSVLERCHLRLAVRDLGGWNDTYMLLGFKLHSTWESDALWGRLWK